MHAFERYAHLLEISNECELKVEEARQTSKSVLTRYEQVKRFRCEAFQDCYRHVSEALAVVYRDLTRSSKHPLGGNAYLTLDNTDEPYLGGYVSLCTHNHF
jgi:structural maintenance of chromosome 1